MAGVYGVEMIEKCLAFGLEMANVAADMSGSSVFTKITQFGRLGDELMGLLDIDFKVLEKEIKEMDQEDKDRLKAFARNKYAVKNPQLEMAVEGSIALAIEFADAILEAYAFYEKLKEPIPEPKVAAKKAKTSKKA